MSNEHHVEKPVGHWLKLQLPIQDALLSLMCISARQIPSIWKRRISEYIIIHRRTLVCTFRRGCGMMVISTVVLTIRYGSQ